jgi:hypothetical protein
MMARDRRPPGRRYPANPAGPDAAAPRLTRLGKPPRRHFFFHVPGDGLPKDHRFPFATLVTSDEYDRFSDLNRPGVFRLNVGVSKRTFSVGFAVNAQ